VATIHVPGTGLQPHGGKHPRRSVIIAAVVLAVGAIVVPLGLRGLDRDGARASAATRVTTPSPAAGSTHRHAVTDAALGPRGDLPALLPGSAGLTDGAHVRLGDVTSGVLRRTPNGTWQVLVRWDGRLQAVPTSGAVRLGAGAAATSWISGEGLLFTRVPTASAHQFRVYAWVPHGGSAYTPPKLVARHLGRVCFNAAFTAFGTCQNAG